MNQRELEAGDLYGAQVDEQDPKQMQVGRLIAVRTKKQRAKQQAPCRIQSAPVCPTTAGGAAWLPQRKVMLLQPADNVSPEAHAPPSHGVLHQGCRHQLSRPKSRLCSSLTLPFCNTHLCLGPAPPTSQSVPLPHAAHAAALHLLLPPADDSCKRQGLLGGS